MFFLRCAFFLSIVYSSMSWTHGSPQPLGTVPHQDLVSQGAAAGRSMATELASQAISGTKQFCAHHLDECLADTARLTALFADEDGSGGLGAVPLAAKGAPRDRSRRHDRDEK